MRHRIVIAGVLGAAMAMLLGTSGCSGLRQHIRQHDFREIRRAEARRRAAPSPIADVLDMNGWTSDLEGAMAFASANGQRTLVFFYREGDAASERTKQTLNAMGRKLSSMQRVAINIAKRKDVASRLGVSRAPAVVVLEPSGQIAARESGELTRLQLVTLLQLK
ncbi:MAG: hypothetical protein KatS3mg130_1091 [Candidatus Sumerlaea sp.]|nr:hypothetical protein [Candidatus Sumerlaea chitinivorans]GIX44683.1 MAG: hypothetical protein KatS3mg130_1091 [Candidatus Sumerlaea sp.]